MEAKWWTKKNSQLTKIKLEKPVKTDYMSLGETQMASTAKTWVPPPSVSVVIGTKTTSLTTLRPDKFTARLMARSASAKCSITSLFVSKLFLTYPFLVGSQDLKCLCKHSCHDHDPNGKRKCLKSPNCRNNCTGFASSHHCNCGQTFDMHETVF